MRYFIIASHYKFAYGLKDTLQFLTNTENNIHDISAYTESAIAIETRIKEIFSCIRPHDEVIVMTDIMGGSVTQKFFPYMSERVHIVSGINVPLAIALILLPNDKPLTGAQIEASIEEARCGIVYVNHFQLSDTAEDE